MIETIDAIYDGAVLRPENALDLQPNTRVRITLEVVGQGSAARSRWKKAK